MENNLSNYQELMDHQFNLLQKIVDLSNDIIHKDYSDQEILENGELLLKNILDINQLNYDLVENFPKEKEVKFIIEQYAKDQQKTLDKMKKEINGIKINCEEIKEESEDNHNNEGVDPEIVEMVKRVAAYNLHEYEDALQTRFH